MDTLIFSKPAVVLRVLSKEIYEHPDEIPYLTITILIEIIIYALALLDTLVQREYGIWPIIKSTKLRSN